MDMRKFSRIFGLVSIIFSFSVQAGVVQLKNGDQVSGEIITMGGKSVIVDTKYAGEIELEWEVIETLTTDGEVTLLLPDKSRAKGKITGVENGQVMLEGGSQPSVNIADIGKINPVPQGTYESSGHIHFGGFRAQGNTEKFALHADAEYVIRNEWNRFTAGTIYNLGGDDGKESENNLRAYGKYDRFIDDHWYGYVNTDFTKDRFQNLDYRIYGGTGLGYQFWDDDVKYLSLEAGPGYTYESFRTGEEDRNYVTARWAMKFHYWLVEEHLQFFHDHEGLISVEDVDDTLVRTHTGFRVPVYNNFDLLAQFDYDYKNKPAEGSEQADYRYILGFGYLF
jgi:putative salt-induced outer membrane protein YdiY